MNGRPILNQFCSVCCFHFSFLKAKRCGVSQLRLSIINEFMWQSNCRRVMIFTQKMFSFSCTCSGINVTSYCCFTLLLSLVNDPVIWFSGFAFGNNSFYLVAFVKYQNYEIFFCITLSVGYGLASRRYYLFD